MRVWPLAFVLSGCSFMFVHGPPPEHEKLPYFDCVSSAAAPVADATVATFAALMTAVMIDDDPDDPEDDNSTSAAVTFGGLAGAHAASSIFGFINASSCSHAKQQLAHRISLAEAERQRHLQELERQLAAEPLGCGSDKDCKGDRLCVQAQCVDPPSPTPPSPAPSSPGPPPAAAEPPAAPAPIPAI